MAHQIAPDSTLGDLVLEVPRRARLFEGLRLDFCCGGQRTLAEACGERQLDVGTIVTVLEAFDLDVPVGTPDDHDVGSASISELCDHIVEAHHDPLRRELPRAAELAATVARVHGDDDSRLRELQRVFDGMRSELEGHMAVEEATLFPACRAVDERPGSDVSEALLAAHEGEHAEVGEALVRLRELSDDYRTEQARCGTHRALLESLESVELDLHQHVHEENNVLFPRVRAAATVS